MSARSERVLVVFAVAAGLLAPAPALHAHPSATWPVLARKDHGADVRALEYVLRHRGAHVKVNGVFERDTNRAVRRFQRRRGLDVDGIVGPRTWRELVPTLRIGKDGPAVRALQFQLIVKRRADVVVNGTFGARTKRATQRFQRHMSIAVDGIAGPVTWRNLLWHYQRNTSGPTMCRYSTEGAWGTASTIRHLRDAGTLFKRQHRGRMAIGHLSREHGGYFPPHVSHRVGLDVDIRPIRRDERQCSYGTEWTSSSYARRGTRLLVEAIRRAAQGRIKVIWFNDPRLVERGLTRRLSGHDNHLHVRYCTVGNPDVNYRC